MFFPPHQLDDLLEQVAHIVRPAGSAVLACYEGAYDLHRKVDDSPVTDADHRAEALILPALRRLAPRVPAVAEEACAEHGLPAVGEEFWLVDPLDGTREFVDRNGEFTVNVALVQRGVPVLGVVLAPALDQLFAGAQGVGAWVEQAGERRALAVRPPPADGLVVVASRSHGDVPPLAPFLAGRRLAGTRKVGSSLKFCLLAEGEADLYPRLGRTMEWDIAAGHAVLAAAGGRVECLDGQPMRYGKPGFENPGFVAWGGAATR
ncbi:3'(2'),5'-bisphosphate nucleotidase CysQ [Piscinibacter defluvii]|uniref:3'(2'),5'-bisphosphate nucleotidase CysQ n=1 Tax=Piscinibacter defluvii TaxID=1796922 RepID=UPI000FDEB43F|nr:3'(2'),5'-bisphosphate nucleotidase CysQ [Piscinibacter defluvii]